jgi:uncharacterized protein YjiS (DUF1127 family)
MLASFASPAARRPLHPARWIAQVRSICQAPAKRRLARPVGWLTTHQLRDIGLPECLSDMVRLELHERFWENKR